MESSSFMKLVVGHQLSQFSSKYNLLQNKEQFFKVDNLVILFLNYLNKLIKKLIFLIYFLNSQSKTNLQNKKILFSNILMDLLSIHKNIV